MHTYAALVMHTLKHMCYDGNAHMCYDGDAHICCSGDVHIETHVLRWWCTHVLWWWCIQLIDFLTFGFWYIRVFLRFISLIFVFFCNSLINGNLWLKHVCNYFFDHEHTKESALHTLNPLKPTGFPGWRKFFITTEKWKPASVTFQVVVVINVKAFLNMCCELNGKWHQNYNILIVDLSWIAPSTGNIFNATNKTLETY